MANPKRASMREGPLAALFRKTEDLEKDVVERSTPDAATPAGAGEPIAEASASASQLPKRGAAGGGRCRAVGSHRLLPSSDARRRAPPFA